MVTYEQLFLFSTYTASLVGLCYQIFKRRKWSSLSELATHELFGDFVNGKR